MWKVDYFSPQSKRLFLKESFYDERSLFFTYKYSGVGSRVGMAVLRAENGRLDLFGQIKEERIAPLILALNKKVWIKGLR